MRTESGKSGVLVDTGTAAFDSVLRMDSRAAMSFTAFYEICHILPRRRFSRSRPTASQSAIAGVRSASVFASLRVSIEIGSKPALALRALDSLSTRQTAFQ